jgi:O-antigen ligase
MSGLASPLPAPLAAGGAMPEDTAQPRWLPQIPPAAIAALALVIAAAAGHFFADGHIGLGVALVLGVCYGPLAFLDLTMALAVYVAILFVQDVSALSVGPNTVGVLVFVGWIGTLATRSARPVTLREHPRLLLALAAFALWLTLSITWATNASAASSGVQAWLIAVVAFVLVLTTLRRPRDVAIIAVAFIVGSVASVAFGVANGALTATAEGASEAALQGRFTGGGGDPNVQAAGFIVAMFLCAGLWSLTSRRLTRAALLLALVTVTIGFFATQSRGGLVSLAFAALMGVVLLPRQRKRLLGLAGAMGIALGVVSIVNPSAIARMSDVGGGTSGRNDIWAVAWHIFVDHRWIGIGLSNFQTIEPRYTLRSGELTRVDLVAEAPHLVHNVYLQLLTETGIVGLAIFLLVGLGSMRASWLAARHFDAGGHVAYGDLARAALMAMLAMLAAQFFISDGEDWRLWILLALGPVLLSIARRTPPSADAGTLAQPPAGRPAQPWATASRSP